jgi:hypothetical protein
MTRKALLALVAGFSAFRAVARAQTTPTYLIQIWIPGRTYPRYVKLGAGLAINSANELETTAPPAPPPPAPTRIRHVKLAANGAGHYPIPAEADPATLDVDANGLLQHQGEHFTIVNGAIVPVEAWRYSDSGNAYDVFISYDRRTA